MEYISGLSAQTLRPMNVFQKAYQLVALALLSHATLASAAQPKELGDVNWLRNYDQAVAASKAQNKPILLLFQEVPGCQGCVDYGQSTLTHPLIVDAIEERFIPLAIHNNKGGHDGEILKRFKEPAWNFQVMRFIDTQGNDLIPRKDRVWTPTATASRMVEALEAAKRPVPHYLQSLAWTEHADTLKTAAFSMYCFWDGEAKLGSIDGVQETEAGWLDGHEVVRLKYDPKTIQWAELVKKARADGCANQIYASDKTALTEIAGEHSKRSKLYLSKNYRTASSTDQKRHLRFSKLKHLSLNPVQKTKINAALSKGDHIEIHKWLSPSQIKTL
ncbi:MAG: VPGUxxT family thioredoxin-like (seleno)protein, type 2 [Opitutaceae bacterium]